jgi:hypothetical protein
MIAIVPLICIIVGSGMSYEEDAAPMKNNDSPKCALSPEQLQERTAWVRTTLAGKIEERKELADGYALRLPNDEPTIKQVHELILLERQCCGSFMTFETHLVGNDGPFWMKLRGPGVRELLAPILTTTPGSTEKKPD